MADVTQTVSGQTTLETKYGEMNIKISVAIVEGDKEVI